MAKYWFRNIFLRNRYFLSSIHVRNTALADGVGHGLFDVLSEPLQEALTIDSAFLPSLLAPIDDEKCHDGLLRFPDPQIPLGQQTYLFLRVAVLLQSLHKIFVLLLLVLRGSRIEGNNGQQVLGTGKHRFLDDKA